MINHKLLKEFVLYDESTGFMYCNKARGGLIKGQRIGNKNSTGYLRTGILGTDYLIHRLAWLYVYGELPDSQIDHINGDILDNRICNLRVASSSQNQQNMRKAQSNNKTGYLGVYIRKNNHKYQATICSNGKRYSLGSFYDPKLASEAYLKAKRELHEFCTI